MKAWILLTGPLFFILLSTGQCDPEQGRTVEHAINQSSRAIDRPAQGANAVEKSPGQARAAILMGSTDFVLMTKEVLRKVSDLPHPSQLIAFQVPSRLQYPAGPVLRVNVFRKGYPVIQLTALARPGPGWGDVTHFGGYCRIRRQGERDYFAKECWLDYPAQIGWPLLKGFLSALLDASPGPVPFDGYPLGAWPADSMVTERIAYYVDIESGDLGTVPRYVVQCPDSVPECLKPWQFLIDEFWARFVSRFPFQPEFGSPLWDRRGPQMIPEADAYLATVPETVYSDDGTIVSGPSPYWTEQDEKAFLSSRLARSSAREDR